MKPISLTSVITLLIALFFSSFTQAQPFGISASAVWISDCNQDNYFNTAGSIGPAANVFTNANLGTHTQNSQTLIFRGAEVQTFKAIGSSNVCSVQMYYRVYPQSGVPGSFSTMNLPFVDDCNVPTNQYPSGGSCVAGNQKWDLVIDDATTVPYSAVDLTAFSAGNYILEVYYEVTGSSTSTSACDETIVVNNSGNNYKASFSIQAPSVASANPVSCNGSEGFITIGGLTAGATYSVGYSDDGSFTAPNSFTANSSGQIVISGLNAGIYSDFQLSINGCTTDLNTGVILSNPVIIPKFNKIAAFCAGTTSPVLLSSSLNGITGSWSPAVIDNQTSRSYTFTPNANQCGVAVTINVTVIPRTTPAFNFGTSLSICADASVPALPLTSTNGISGSWSPAVVDNQNSGTYTFTPSGNQCANPATFSVTVAPNITPSFSFGSSLTICAGNSVPSLTTTSDNGIAGTWSPATVDNLNPGSYTFTPSAGQCATTTVFNVAVNPVVTAAFSFGTSLNICAGGSVPSLPATSTNGVAGTWSPSSVDNQTSGVYTFTPSSSCNPPVTFSVTVAPNIAPTFAFGTSLTICAGAAVPILPNTSDNGITGTWSPATVDNNNSGTYTFTPTSGQCATSAVFTVTVNPVITPVFATNIYSICAGSTAPVLPATSDNGVTGTWTPVTVSNTASATYTFTPDPGQCAISTTIEVDVIPMTTPTFAFGTSLWICSGGTVPVLSSNSDEGYSGLWSPSVVSNTNSATYTFTPDAGQCANPTSFTVTVSPNVTPVFDFGTSLSICSGGIVPALSNISSNGITGTWSPAIADNNNSGTYTFTPDAGQCALSTQFTVTVNAYVTPTFSIGSSTTMCQGSSAPVLSSTSDNGITGTWSPAVVDNQNSALYAFTADAGQCANSVNFDVTVNPNVIPTFSFGTSLVICAGDNVPTLPTTSINGLTGTWSPAIVDNQASSIYTFTPDAVSGQCLTSTNFVVTVNQKLTPTFSFGPALTICGGANVPALSATSANGITGTWSPTNINNQSSDIYTFTPDAGQCVASGFILTVTVPPVATVDFESDTTVTDGTTITTNILSGTPSGVNFTWTNSNTAIGLAGSGTGTIPSFIATNKESSTIKGTVTVTPNYSGCAGTAKSYVITVIPLDKDIFVPNVFTPNGDGKNDILYAYSNYINKLEMRIFNQYGQQIEVITDSHKGWDGKYKGTPQPVGVYMYMLKATLTDGRIVQSKGSITLLR